jgi:hypothetical protein
MKFAPRLKQSPLNDNTTAGTKDFSPEPGDFDRRFIRSD